MVAIAPDWCAAAGRVVAIAPDWPVMAIDGKDLDAAHPVLAEIAEHVRKPMAGRSLPAWMTAAGLVLDRVHLMTFPVRSLDGARQLGLTGEVIDRLDYLRRASVRRVRIAGGGRL